LLAIVDRGFVVFRLVDLGLLNLGLVNLGLVNLGLVNLGLVNLGLVNLGLVNLRLVILTCPFNPFQCPGDGQRGRTASGLVGRAQADGQHPRLLHLGPRRSHRARNGRRIKFSLQRFVEKVDLCSFPDLNAIEISLGVSTVETSQDRDRERPSCRD